MVQRMDVEQALEERRSVRGFLPDPVDPKVLTRVFERAQRAPSWCNIQPWRVWVASGATRDRLVAAYIEAAKTGMPEPELEWPPTYPEPYGTHRKECGIALYGAMGVTREDKAGRYAAWMRNYEAFDAPHVALIGFDTRIGIYAGLDVGCWLQSLLLAAWSEGIASCAMASLAAYPGPARAVLDIPNDVKLAFGLALGFEDPSVAANQCRTTRAPLAANVTFASD